MLEVKVGDEFQYEGRHFRVIGFRAGIGGKRVRVTRFNPDSTASKPNDEYGMSSTFNYETASILIEEAKDGQ